MIRVKSQKEQLQLAELGRLFAMVNCRYVAVHPDMVKQAIGQKINFQFYKQI